ncbi:MAG: hypothetical protein ABIR16_01655, partial [Dokdonella sp.]
MAGSSLLIYRNWAADSATVLTASYSGATNGVTAGFPLDNLKTRQLDDVCRQTPAGSFYVTADL